jgi:hypothetical protein
MFSNPDGGVAMRQGSLILGLAHCELGRMTATIAFVLK